MVNDKNDPLSSGGQQKNEEELVQEVREWKSPSNLPDGLAARIDEISSEIWSSKGLPLPIRKIFDDLRESCDESKYPKDFFNRVYLGYKELLDRTSLSEWSLGYGIKWHLYAELRGHIFSKYDPNREEDE